MHRETAKQVRKESQRNKNKKQNGVSFFHREKEREKERSSSSSSSSNSSNSGKMTFSKGTMVVGAIATYAAAVFVGYQYARRGKAQNFLNVDNETGTPIDPKNIVLQDSQRLASFNKHATTYDNGKLQVLLCSVG